MANMCENKVIFRCRNNTDIGVLKKLICGKGGVLDFHKIVPLGDVSGKENSELYSHVVEAWGVKCSVSDVSDYRELHHSDESMEFDFDTPWSPPTGIVSRIKELIDENDLDVYFNWAYFEPGEDLHGVL
jgi:hypothetical protein